MTQLEKFEELLVYKEFLKWISVPSTNLYAIDYTEQDQILKVEFQSGSVYQYYQVPIEIYEKLQTHFPYKSQEYIRSNGKIGSAFSLGSYFYFNIRDKYRYKKL